MQFLLWVLTLGYLVHSHRDRRPPRRTLRPIPRSSTASLGLPPVRRHSLGLLEHCNQIGCCRVRRNCHRAGLLCKTGRHCSSSTWHSEENRIFTWSYDNASDLRNSWNASKRTKPDDGRDCAPAPLLLPAPSAKQRTKRKCNLPCFLRPSRPSRRGRRCR